MLISDAFVQFPLGVKSTTVIKFATSVGFSLAVTADQKSLRLSVACYIRIRRFSAFLYLKTEEIDMKTNSKMKSVIKALTGSTLTVALVVGGIAAVKWNDASAGRPSTGGGTVLCTSDGVTFKKLSKPNALLACEDGVTYCRYSDGQRFCGQMK